MQTPDDEWEYEYDSKAIEVFLVDLDLATVNQTVKTTTANRQKRLNDTTDVAANKKRKISKPSKNINNANSPIDVESSIVDRELQTPGRDDSTDYQDDDRSKSVQILDLSSANPIVAYKGEIFSCRWTDMVGTTMFLTHPQELPLYDPQLSAAEYDMIGTSRIKLVGTRTKVSPIQQTSNEEALIPSGQSLGTIRRNNAKVNADLRKQATFLEQLMNIKTDRGETDNVFVTMNDDIASAVAANRLTKNANAQTQKLRELNREAVKGNADALKQIEDIYLGQNFNDIDEDATLFPAEQPQSGGSDSDATPATSNRPRVLGTASPSPDASSHPNPKNTNEDDG